MESIQWNTTQLWKRRRMFSDTQGILWGEKTKCKTTFDQRKQNKNAHVPLLMFFWKKSKRMHKKPKKGDLRVGVAGESSVEMGGWESLFIVHLCYIFYFEPCDLTPFLTPLKLDANIWRCSKIFLEEYTLFVTGAFRQVRVVRVKDFHLSFQELPDHWVACRVYVQLLN